MNRGLRNNNPGNIKQDPNNHWKGLADDQPDPTFVKFKSLDWGYRAMWILLNNYWHVHGCKTLRQVIRRWAPPNENATEHYLKTVMKIIPSELLPIMGQSPVDSGAIGDRREGGTEAGRGLLQAPDQNYQLWQEIIVAMVRMEGNYTPDCRDHIRKGYRMAFGK